MHTEYGAVIKTARKAKGLTLAALAVEIGVSVPYLHDVEAGRRGRLAPEREEAVAKVLMLDPTRLAVLGAMARGTVDVSGLEEKEVARVVRMVSKMRSQKEEKP